MVHNEDLGLMEDDFTELTDAYDIAIKYHFGIGETGSKINKRITCRANKVPYRLLTLHRAAVKRKIHEKKLSMNDWVEIAQELEI